MPRYKPDPYNELDQYGGDISNRDTYDEYESSEPPLPINKLRVNSLFGTNVPIDRSESNHPSQSDYDINSLYKPNVYSRDRYNSLLDQFPEKNNPSFARKLVAAGMGLNSKNPIDDMEKVMYAPYLREMGAWKEKTKPYYDAADLEGKANIQERTIAGNILTNKYQTDKLMEQSRIADMRNETIRQKNENDAAIARDRNNIARFKAENPDWKFDTSGDNVYALNPNGQQRINLGPKNAYTEMDLVERRGQFQVAAAQQQGMNQAGVANIRNNPNIMVGGVLHQYNPNTGEYEPAQFPGGNQPPGNVNTVGRPSTTNQQREIPSQTKARQEAMLEAIFRQNDDYSKHVDMSSGTPVLRPRPKPSTGFWAGGDNKEDIERWDTINRSVYGDSSSPGAINNNIKNNNPLGGSSNNKSSQSSGVNNGQLAVVQDMKTGQKFTIPITQVNDFIREHQGQYTRLK